MYVAGRSGLAGRKRNEGVRRPGMGGGCKAVRGLIEKWGSR